MSWGALHWALDQDIQDGIAKFLLVILAERASPETLELYRTVQNLARDTSQSERTVQRKLRWLEAEGYIERLNNFDEATGRQRANEFVVLAPDTVKRGRSDEARPRNKPRTRPGEGVTQSPSPEAGRVTDSHREGDSAVTGEGDTAVTPKNQTTTIQTRTDSSDPDGSAPPGGAGTRDFRKDLFDRGVRTVRALTGRPELRCRTLIGSWLKFVADDAVTVLRAIDEAVGAETIDPVGWIEMRLKRRSTAGAQPAVITPPDAIARRNEEAQQLAERGEWPIGGTVFVAADSPAGAAWERHFERFGKRARWTVCGAKGLGWHMPSLLPPTPAAVAVDDQGATS